MRSPARRKTRSTLRKSSTGACRSWSCARIRRRGHQRRQTSSESPPREEGWLRHQENFGEAHLSAADGVVAHKYTLRCERPPRPLSRPPLIVPKMKGCSMLINSSPACGKCGKAERLSEAFPSSCGNPHQGEAAEGNR